MSTQKYTNLGSGEIEVNKYNHSSSINNKRQRVFIGSSVEGLQIAKYVQLNLDHLSECTVWSQGVFSLSDGTLENLTSKAREFDFAILVLTPDDLVSKRGKIRIAPRDNVLFELGLFMGALGRDRTFIVHCRDDRLDLPSDLAGITCATFGVRSDLRAALGAPCTQIEEAMSRVYSDNATRPKHARYGLVDRYRDGERNFSWERHDGVRLNKGDSLKGANLEKVDFDGAILANVILAGTNLKRASLRLATLNAVDFSNANLEGANFWKATMSDANLTNANLSGANLRSTTLLNATIKGSKNGKRAKLDRRGAVIDFTTFAASNWGVKEVQDWLEAQAVFIYSSHYPAEVKELIMSYGVNEAK